jgi:hypothetical protein
MQLEETTTTTSLKPTRASFIRSLPLEMPVEEVIERGREAGIVVQPSDVHAARYYMRQAAAREAASKPPSIAQQLMLGGTITPQRRDGRDGQDDAREPRETRDKDETAGLTKIAGVRNGSSAASVVSPTTANRTVIVRPTPKPVVAETGKRPRGGKSARKDPSQESVRAEISIDDVLASMPSPSKGRGARRATPAPAIDGSMDEQLHSLVLRLGTQRAREIIEQIEETALKAR